MIWEIYHLKSNLTSIVAVCTDDDLTGVSSSIFALDFLFFFVDDEMVVPLSYDVTGYVKHKFYRVKGHRPRL